MPLDFDRTIIGGEFDRTVLPPVTREEILEYSDACGEAPLGGAASATGMP